jgi:proprotein convertase subtilisin/kexin type 5
MKSQILKILLLFAIAICINTCDDGSYSDANGICQQCDISCSTCRSSDGCHTCYDQMYLIARGNLIVCDLCYNVNKGCDICITATKCQNCSSGYFLDQDNTCSKCNTLIPNCLLCQVGNSTLCVSCINPYQPINGGCFSNNSDSTTNLIVSQNISTVSKTTTPQQNPIVSCDPSQVNVNGNCYLAIAFCQSYSLINGSCISCLTNFLLSNGYCLPAYLLLTSNINQAA